MLVRGGGKVGAEGLGSMMEGKALEGAQSGGDNSLGVMARCRRSRFAWRTLPRTFSSMLTASRCLPQAAMMPARLLPSATYTASRLHSTPQRRQRKQQ